MARIDDIEDSELFGCKVLRFEEVEAMAVVVQREAQMAVTSS